MDLWHRSNFYQYLVYDILDWVMRWFSSSRAINYLYFVWMVKHLLPVWTMFLYFFSCDIIEVNHLFIFFIFTYSISSGLLTLPAPVKYGYDVTPSNIYSLLLQLSLSVTC